MTKSRFLSNIIARPDTAGTRQSYRRESDLKMLLKEETF